MDPLKQLQARFECIDLVEKVRRAADEDDLDGFVGSFASDATWSRPGADPMVGRDAIRATMQRRPAGRVMRHVTGGADAELIGEDRAVVHSQALIYAVAHEGPFPAPLPAPQRIIEYRDDLVRTRDGWKIAARVTTVVFDADVQSGH